MKHERIEPITSSFLEGTWSYAAAYEDENPDMDGDVLIREFGLRIGEAECSADFIEHFDDGSRQTAGFDALCEFDETEGFLLMTVGEVEALQREQTGQVLRMAFASTGERGSMWVSPYWKEHRFNEDTGDWEDNPAAPHGNYALLMWRN